MTSSLSLQPNPINLAQAFLDGVVNHPDRMALVSECEELTYAQLGGRVQALRGALGVLNGRCVGVLAHKSPVAYAAVQAILAQGGTYVPLNPAFPAARNAYIAQKAGLDTLVVGDECADALEALVKHSEGHYALVCHGDAPGIRSLLECYPDRLSLVPTNPDDAPAQAEAPAELAYVLFTSGSTGQPKGVMVRHENVASYLRSLLSLYPIDPEDRITQTFDLTFDLSVHDQFVCWTAGATLVAFPDRALQSPLEWTSKHGVTVWFSVPSVAAFLESTRQVIHGALPGIRLSLFCGEKLTWKTVQLWRSIAPNSRISNLYGPTEATIAITHHEILSDFRETDAYQGGIPIGQAFPGQRTRILREDGNTCPQGEVGALWLGGDQVTPGYLGDQEKTLERFVERDGEVWYRTGDLVLQEASGVIQYVGREDFQVKVMGYRIELGEIEHALMRASDAAFALADVARIRGDIDEIFCVLPAHCKPQRKSIKAEIKQILPSYMVPRKFYFTDDIPLNANGKMDRGVIKRRAEGGSLSE